MNPQSIQLWQMQGRFYRLTRPKLEGGGTHDGVHLPDGRVLHITAERGLEVCGYGDFEQQREVRIKSMLDPAANDHAWTRVRQLLRENRAYDALTNNCETVARKVMGEPNASPQALVWGLVAVGAVLAAVG